MKNREWSSLNSDLSSTEAAVAERIRLENADAEYFRARAARASGRPLGEILDQGRDNLPDPGDEL